MAAEWVEVGKEVLKLAVRARYSFTIWVVTLAILVVPLPDFLGLDTFRLNHRQYLGLVCLISFALWVVEVALLMSGKVQTHFAERKTRRDTLKFLESLTTDEARILAYAINQKVQTVTARDDTEEGVSLAAKGLLVPIASDQSGYVPYLIPHFVWVKINETETVAKLQTRGK